jgi:hypothetical protein
VWPAAPEAGTVASKNRIFISFAVEDAWARDFLVG